MKTINKMLTQRLCALLMLSFMIGFAPADTVSAANPPLVIQLEIFGIEINYFENYPYISYFHSWYPIPNAEVAFYRHGTRVGTVFTNENGTAFFRQPNFRRIPGEYTSWINHQGDSMFCFGFTARLIQAEFYQFDSGMIVLDEFRSGLPFAIYHMGLELLLYPYHQVLPSYGVIVDERLSGAYFSWIYMSRHTFLSLRDISDLLGAEIRWDGATGTVNVTYNNATAEMVVGSRAVTLRVPDGVQYAVLDWHLPTFDGRVYLPLRFASEFFGLDVEWYGCIHEYSSSVRRLLDTLERRGYIYIWCQRAHNRIDHSNVHEWFKYDEDLGYTLITR